MRTDDTRTDHRLDATEQSTGTTTDAQPVAFCPFCGSRETELVSLFGGQLSTDQYYCCACRSYFERFTRDAEGARG